MKHNNEIYNAHFHKDWDKRVRTWFNQPARKERRRANRVKKAAAVFPRPASGLLRPIVRCPTLRYQAKQRLGKGFTFAELKAANINKYEARSIGIAVDHRRSNKSEEGFAVNVARLNEYKAKLVLFPKKAGAPKAGEASAEEVAAATQYSGTVLPIQKAVKKTEFRVLDEAERSAGSAFETLRIQRANARLTGIRKKKRLEREEAKKNAKGGKKKGKK